MHLGKSAATLVKSIFIFTQTKRLIQFRGGYVLGLDTL